MPVDDLTAEQLKREVRALDGLRHPVQLGRVWAAIDAVFAERDGLRTDLIEARAQIEAVCRSRDELHEALVVLTTTVEGHRCVADCAVCSDAPRVRAEIDAAEDRCATCTHARWMHGSTPEHVGKCWDVSLSATDGIACRCLEFVPDAAAVERAQAAAP